MGLIAPVGVQSIEGVGGPGRVLDIVVGGSLQVTGDNSTGTITLTETHSERTDNPHGVTAEQVGAVRNAGGVPQILADLAANRPAPDTAKAGRLFYATDTRQLWRDSGSAWEELKPSSAADADQLGGQPPTYYATEAALSAHTGRTDNPHGVTAAQVGALASVAGVSNPGGDVAFTAGRGISITPDDVANRVTFASSVRAAIIHKELDPVSQSYPVGITVLQTYSPAAGYESILLQSWTLPPAAGNVQPGIRFIFNDASTVDRYNAGGTALTEKRPDIEFAKDGLYISQVAFIANNVGAAAETQDLGLFKLDGEQV